jgi:hypothetical protein
MHELMRTAVLSSETNIFAIHPGISFPAKEWVDADPDFWKPPKAVIRASYHRENDSLRGS